MSKKQLRSVNPLKRGSIFGSYDPWKGTIFAKGFRKAAPASEDDPGGWLKTFAELDAKKIAKQVREDDAKFNKERDEFSATLKKERSQEKKDFYKDDAIFKKMVAQKKPASGKEARCLAIALLKDTPEIIDGLAKRKDDKERMAFIKKKIGHTMKIPAKEALDIMLPKRGFLHSKYGRKFAYCGIKSGCYYPKGIAFTYKNSRRFDVLKREDFIRVAMECLKKPALLKAWEKDRHRRYNAECKALERKRKASDAKWDMSPAKKVRWARKQAEFQKKVALLAPIRNANDRWLNNYAVVAAEKWIRKRIGKKPPVSVIEKFLEAALQKRGILKKDQWLSYTRAGEHTYRGGYNFPMYDPPEVLIPGATIEERKPVAPSQTPVASNPAFSSLPLKAIQRYLPDMARKGVSTVARSPRGFLTAYRRAGGKLTRLSRWWRNRRIGFIKRHMAQVRKRREKLWDNGKPSRRALALIAWAYMPKRA